MKSKSAAIDPNNRSKWLDLSEVSPPNICQKCKNYHVIVREDKEGNLVEHPELKHGICGTQVNEWGLQKLVFAWSIEECFEGKEDDNRVG